jgi:CheY-like chemotaxis protein
MEPSPVELTRLRHDLRNPLGQIVGFAEILAEEAQSAHIRSLLDPLHAIQEAANDALHAVNETLTMRPEGLHRAEVHRLSSQLQTCTEVIHRKVADVRGLNLVGPPNSLAEDLQRIDTAAGELASLAAADLPRYHRRQAAALDGPHAASKQPCLSEPASAPSPAPEQGHILVVDDNAEIREILRRRLAPLGYELRLASSGAEALEMIRTQPVDLLLLDIVMPGVDGFEVLNRLKCNPATQHIPVVMLSAVDEMEAVVRCIELGAEDYLPKPFPAALLKARVRACLASKRLADQLRKYTEWLFGPALFAQAVTAPLSLSLHEQERTVLFADIRGFTAWTERRPPSEVVQMLNHYFERAEKVLALSEVIKTEYTGDEIMAVLGEGAHGLDAAVQLQRELGALLSPLDLGIGIGLHHGPVIEGLMGSAEVKAYSFVGDTINTARRICDHARAGKILASRTVYPRKGPGPEVTRRRQVFRAKGKKELIEVFEVRWEGS